MAAQLNIIGDVAFEGEELSHRQVQVIVRREQVKVTRGATVLAQKDQVMAVEPNGPRGWLIRFGDGTTWAARLPERKGPRGCGCH